MRVTIRTVRWQTVKQAGLLAAVAVLGGAVLCWPQAVATGISRGLSVSGGVLIPGLFPFLVLSGFLVRSGLCDSIGRRLQKAVRFLFYLPGCCAPAILIGLCGGYPAGGAAIAELYKNGSITAQQGKRLLRFCVNAGPAFVVSTVGAGLLGDVRVGWLLYAAHAAAALLIGIGDGVLERLSRTHTTPNGTPTVKTPQPPLTALVGSVNAACGSLVSMGGFVMLFSALLSVLDGVGVMAWLGQDSLLGALLPGFFEVSCGCIEAADHRAAVLLLGTMMGWGGLSVHGQLAATLSGTGMMDRGFFAARLLQALLGGVLSVGLFSLVSLPLATLQNQTAQGLSAAVFFQDATTAAALLLMCGLFLLGTGKRPLHRVESCGILVDRK